MGKHRYAAATLTLSLAALTGCGSSTHSPGALRQATVPAYDAYPPDTISVSGDIPRSPACRSDARSFARTARFFLAHSGPKAAYPADLYYVLMREAIADFGVRHCSPEVLGRALERALSARRRRTLVADLPRQMADIVRQALAAVGS
jgi:hypothetical protein